MNLSIQTIVSRFGAAAALVSACLSPLAQAEPWRIAASGDVRLHVFNMSAGELRRADEPTCKMFSDKDGHALVQPDRVRMLGTSAQPSWTKAQTCERTYCLRVPDWHWSGNTTIADGVPKNSCFVLSMSSSYKNLCTRGYSASCNQYLHYVEIRPANLDVIAWRELSGTIGWRDMVGLVSRQELFTAVEGQNNELGSARFWVTLQKTGALVISDRGTSYRP